MSSEPIHVLLVEDAPDDADLVVKMLGQQKDRAYLVEHVDRLAKGLDKLSQGGIDVVLLDLSLPDSHGVETVIRAHARFPQMPVVVLTGLEDELAGLEALKKGAQDYLVKGETDGHSLSRAVLFAIERERMGRRNGKARPTPEPAIPRSISQGDELSPSRAKWRKSAEGLVYASDAMRRILGTIDRVARERVPVLIYGETGTGKELIASAIHHNTLNPRKDKPFISINCASLTEPLLESELFGHARGAFTGAVAAKQGILEAIDGGTLFLDEIPEASPTVQAKLLRVLDSGEYLKLGETRPRQVDVRILAATNKNLPEEISAKRFREDLFQRLNTVTIFIPPLRERPEDIPALIDFFLEQYNRSTGKTLSITEDVRRVLIDTRWIGNVRELKNLIQNLCIMADDESKVITSNDLLDYSGRPRGEHARNRIPKSADGRDGNGQTLSDVRTYALRQAQKEYIVRLLRENRGNVTASAQAANVSRRYLTQLLKEFNIRSKRFKK